jgi:hypothetical protein
VVLEPAGLCWQVLLIGLKVAGEEYPRPEFFVQMIAYNKDRQRPSTDSKRGEAPIPVLYDSRQAYITF